MWAYSTKRAVRDTKTLTLQENKARAVVAGQKAARTPRFVKTANGAARLDEASLARARRLVGLKGYVTNISVEVMPAAEVIASYHDLWHVEQSFRMSKTDLRPPDIPPTTATALSDHRDNGTEQTFPPLVPDQQQAILDTIQHPGSHALNK